MLDVVVGVLCDDLKVDVIDTGESAKVVLKSECSLSSWHLEVVALIADVDSRFYDVEDSLVVFVTAPWKWWFAMAECLKDGSSWGITNDEADV